ncbi:MAG: hypothetical protein H6835_10820 [Planctomycetes bacterium]|nr:hypothetical protein [Planctomycetota bacterium]
MPQLRSFVLPSAIAAATSMVSAQSYVDLVDSRNAAQGFTQLFMIEAGAIGTKAEGKDRAGTAVGDLRADRGLDDVISWDGRVYYRDEKVGSRRGTLEAYAGRDGLFGAFTDGKLIGDDTVTRLEFHGRPWQFYRDGFYVGDTLRRNGFYEGSDYEGYLGFGREANDGIYIEFGPYYKQFTFRRPDRASLVQSDFVLPGDYTAYGGRLYVEQRAVQMDRRRGMPRSGSVLTLIGEREWNDSQGTFGRVGFYETELPSAVWRARGRLEWYIPAGDGVTFEVFVHGGWQDEKDRLQNTEGQRPLGNQWADGQVRMRWDLADWWTLTPYFELQYSHTPNERGLLPKRQFFLGGGLETYVHFGESLSLHGYYSYLDNDNRPSVRIDRDIHAESMFYLGMVLRLGVQRR